MPGGVLALRAPLPASPGKRGEGPGPLTGRREARTRRRPQPGAGASHDVPPPMRGNPLRRLRGRAGEANATPEARDPLA